MNLRDWRKGKGWTQGDLADKLGEPRPTFQKMESGAGPITPESQNKLRKLGYTGPWPREEAKEQANGTISADLFHREIGKLEGRLETLERAFERLGEAVRGLLLREPEGSLPRKHP